MNHKWNLDDTCERCGLKRRFTRLSPKGRQGILSGRPGYEFYVNNQWVFARTECKPKE
jgi:hypothetical protein